MIQLLKNILIVAGGIGGVLAVVSFFRTEISMKRLKRRLQKKEKENNTLQEYIDTLQEYIDTLKKYLKKYLPKTITMESKDFIKLLEKK